MQIFLIKNKKFKIKNSKLPSCYRVIVDIIGDFINDSSAEFVLHIRKETVGIESLVRGISAIERLLGVDIIREMDRDADSKFAFGSIAIRFDGSLGDVVTDYFALYLQVSVLTEDLQACLARIEVSEGFGEGAAEGRVDHRRVVGEIGDGDRMGGLIVDVRAVHFVTNTAAAQAEQHAADRA